MRPRREDRYVGDGTTVTIDLMGGVSLAEAKTESKSDVRSLLWRKIESIDPSIRGSEQLVLQMLGCLRLALAGENRSAAGATNLEAAWLTRALALHQAGKAIERDIDALRSVAAVFDHNEGLPANALWPE